MPELLGIEEAVWLQRVEKCRLWLLRKPATWSYAGERWPFALGSVVKVQMYDEHLSGGGESDRGYGVVIREVDMCRALEAVPNPLAKAAGVWSRANARAKGWARDMTLHLMSQHPAEWWAWVDAHDTVRARPLDALLTCCAEQMAALAPLT